MEKLLPIYKVSVVLTWTFKEKWILAKKLKKWSGELFFDSFTSIEAKIQKYFVRWSSLSFRNEAFSAPANQNHPKWK